MILPERDYHHITIQSKNKFDPNSFRVITLKKTKGVLMTVGCPRGKWSGSRCTVGMQCQKLLFPKKNYTKEQAEDWTDRHRGLTSLGRTA